MQREKLTVQLFSTSSKSKIFLLIAWIFSTVFSGCDILKFRKSDQYHISTNLKLGYKTEVKYFQIGKQKIRCLVTGNPNGKNLFLLHGSPASLSAWIPLYADTAFMQTFKIIAIDRPGYGYSDFGHVETSIAKQAEIIEAIMDSLNLPPTILLGASYGGPIAVQIAMHRPQQIQHLVLLLASVKPTAEKTYWISHLMTAPVIMYAFPAIFRMSSKEKFSHAAELAKLKNWDSIKSPTSIIHGDKDHLVYFSNAEFLKGKILNSKLYIMKGKGHGLSFRETEYFKKMLWEVLITNGPPVETAEF